MTVDLDAPIAGSAQVQQGKPGENNTPAPVEVAPKFSIPRPEMIPVVRTPEVMANPIKLSEESQKALKDTVAYHFEIIDKIAKGTVSYTFPSDSLQGVFYSEFRRRFPDKDLSDPEKLQKAAEEFIAKGGAEVRLALKLAEWEAVSIQAACGRMFMARSGSILPRLINEAKGKARYIWGPTGFQRIDKTPGIIDQIKGIRLEAITEYELSGGERMDLTTTNTLLNAEQTKFLETCGWSTTNLSDAQRTVIDDRLATITALRSDIYLKIGVKPKDIEGELNFIRKDASPLGRRYLTTKTARLLGEGAAGADVRAILAEEGKRIAQEVKDKVQKEIDEKKKETGKRKAERTVDQLTRRIAEIKATAGLTDAEKTVKITEVNAEIQRLQKKLELFSRQRLLAGEIADATTASEEAKKKVEAHQSAKANTIAGESDVDLFKWSGDVSESESCAAIQVQIDALEEIKRPFAEQLTDINSQITEHYPHKPAERLERTTTRETKGGTTTEQIIEPDALDKEIKQRWFGRLKQLEELKDNILKQINEDKTQDGDTETLSGKLAKLKAKIVRRKAVLADAEIKALLDEYHEAEKTLKQRTTEQTDVAAKITPAGSGTTPLNEDDIKKGIKTKEDEKKALEIGGLMGENKLEVEALSALTAVYPPEKQTERESRTKEAEQGIIGPPEYGPQWKDYPPAVLRCVQLVWGDELLEAGPANKELADQVMALMRSKKYLSIIIEGIESISGITFSTPANKSATITDGAYTNLSAVFAPRGIDATIKSLAFDKITREVIEKIVEKMRRTALNITTAP